MRATSTALAVALGALSLSLAGEAQAKPAFCAPSERPCTRLFVPLDRSSGVPGSVPIQVERTGARKAVRAPLFLIAGGPGQSSTRAFDRQSVRELLGSEARARDVYVIDPRGTGDSGLLRCNTLQMAGIFDVGSAAGACARQLGAGRAFYTARDSADDLEAVRRELDVSKIALLGVSYGTKVGLAYARRYPDHVDRLVLDSVLEAESTPDPLYRPNFAAVPRVLQALCRRGACRSFTRDPVRDVARLAARAERSPLTGRVIDRRGRAHKATLSGFDLFGLLLAGDLDPGVRARFPGLVRGALQGDTAPILRAAKQANAAEGGAGDAAEFSVGAYAAATCEESPLPWSRGAPFTDRARQARAYALAQPRSVFSPFGPRTALGSDVLSLCGQWPEASPARPVGGLPPRAVPTLMLEGEADVRTPVENARAVAGRLGQARVLEVPATGHSTLTSDSSNCAVKAARRFLATGIAPARCPRRAVTLRPEGPAPTSVRRLSTTRRTGGKAGRTLTGVKATVDDVAAQIAPLLVDSLVEALGGKSRPVRVGGLRGGSAAYTLLRDRLELRDVVVVPGLRVSGTIRGFLQGTKLRASLRVRGRSAARGTLRVSRRTARGRLGGRPIRDRLNVGGIEQVLEAKAARRGRADVPPIR